MLFDEEIYKHIARSFHGQLKDAHDEAAMWRKKFDTWREEIPNAIEQNKGYGRRISRFIDEKVDAERRARDAEKKAK